MTGGLARLATGTVFRNGYQSHAATETCPGHSTILTGSQPSRNGIIANDWFDLARRVPTRRSIAPRTSASPAASSTNYTVSPVHLKVPTLGERMKRANPASRSVAVAGKDRAAVMMGGQRPDQRWYWDGKKYATDLAGVTVPASVAAANQTVAALIAAPGLPLTLPADCVAKARAVPVGDGKFSVGSGRFARAAGDARAFRATPAFDGMTLALARAADRRNGARQGPASDVIAIGLSATDYVGHSYGNGGGEMCLQLHSLDRDLGDFLAPDGPQRDRLCGHAHRRPWRARRPRTARGQGRCRRRRSRPDLTATAVGKAIAARLKLAGPVLIGEGAHGDIYLDRALSPADRRRALAAAVAAYRADPQVEAVFTSEQLARVAVPRSSPDRWSLIERVRASLTRRARATSSSCSSATSPRSPTRGRLCRDPRQPVGL